MLSEVLKQRNLSRDRFSLVIPVHNEAGTIQDTIMEFYHEVGRKIPSAEIIVCEDGSTDGTKEILFQLSQRIPLKLILGNQRKGYMEGMKDGLRKVNSDLVLAVDSDGQYVASDFWKFYDKRNNCDMIVGRKIKRGDPPHRILLSKVFHLMVRFVFRLPLHDPDTAYHLIKKSVLNSVAEDVSILKYSFWTEFTVRAFKKGFKITEVPVHHRRRTDGSTRLYSTKKLFRIVCWQLIGLFRLWRELRGSGKRKLK